MAELKGDEQKYMGGTDSPVKAMNPQDLNQPQQQRFGDKCTEGCSAQFEVCCTTQLEQAARGGLNQACAPYPSPWP